MWPTRLGYNTILVRVMNNENVSHMRIHILLSWENIAMIIAKGGKPDWLVRVSNYETVSHLQILLSWENRLLFAFSLVVSQVCPD